MLTYRNDFMAFPSELIDRITGASISEISSKSNAHVYRVQKPDRTICYLKTNEVKTGYELVNEVMVYDWLDGKVKSPKVLYYDTTGDIEYMLYSEIEGSTGNSRNMIKNPNLLIKIIARALKQLHSIDISKCEINQTLDIKLKKAKRRVEENLVEDWDFQPENKDKSPQQIYNELIQTKPTTEDLVFTHGDCCLSNIIIAQDNGVGFVDMERGGIADRYQDIAVFIRDIKNKLGVSNDNYVQLFLNEYGIDEPDLNKIEYYILLDELF